MLQENVFFELDGPQALFTEIQSAITEYHQEPNSRLFLFLVFGLNHLREWIAQRSYEDLNKKRKTNTPLTANETFYFALWEIEEFRIINSLCNRSKHFSIKADTHNTSIAKGFRCDSPCGDSLGQKYYLIDGIDSRDIFARVIREYYQWFSQQSEGS
ncbi:hypothetical protein [Vogesella indigofera]|uniref:hypothetical protein n=1 Tax=Vogesella indigofera TaxID=45465 RepID=UPI0035B4EF44